MAAKARFVCRSQPLPKLELHSAHPYRDDVVVLSAGHWDMRDDTVKNFKAEFMEMIEKSHLCALSNFDTHHYLCHKDDEFRGPDLETARVILNVVDSV